MGFISEFKKFAMRGNVMDMAVGVIIGGAFGKIISSLVDDVIMPVVGKAVGNVDFTNLFVNLSDDTKYDSLAAAKEAGVSILAYGQFIQTAVDFIIVAFCVFMVIKGINKLSSLKKKKEEESAPAAPAGPTQEELLAEIRDLLKNK